MAKFEIADKLTGINEGGYANNPSDRGGETYAGIARNFWASWPGWKYIDRYKADYSKALFAGKTKLTLAKWVNASAKVPTEPVRDLVVSFYKREFWDANKLDQINDQQLANSVYDFGVNSGKGRAVQFLESIFGVIKDGIMDPVVIRLANASDPKKTLTEYNAMRRAAYISWAKGDQAQFLSSWLSRLKPYKLILFILLPAALILLSGCGTRQVNKKSLKTQQIEKEEAEKLDRIKREIDDIAREQSRTKNDKKNTVTEKTTTEKLDSLGRVRERVTQEKTQEQIDKTEAVANSFRRLRTNLDSLITNKTYRNILITNKSKQGDVKADKSIKTNIGWYGVIAGVVVFGVIVFFGLRSRGLI